jgi:hypothetical protein
MTDSKANGDAMLETIKAGMRKCKSCGLVLPLEEFYKTGTSKDGRRFKCKDCVLATHRKHNRQPEVIERRQTYWQKYVQRPDVAKSREEYIHKYNQRPEVKRRKSAYAKQWATKAKRKAYAATTRAVERGELKPARAFLCVDCGKQAEQYFYEDYNLPPKIIPVCLSCHRKRVCGSNE